MNQAMRLRWRRHRLSNTDETVVRRMAENLFPMSSLARSAGRAAVEVDENIDLPELPESSLGKAAPTQVEVHATAKSLSRGTPRSR
jgi:hypothetical protein